MRIQHNIMAMSAYRNYTNNVSAMKKNLEKLSSGYKINRAGDDAAGLAISEKMRAQITGLETAQKNAKDGISLVQTAEGALTEVHDMLNRMVELATQSANGTYDDTTDRAQMQKEINQLLEEIDRIADSSNFNGINLLDGTLGMNTDAFEVTGTVDGADAQAGAAIDLTITAHGSAGTAKQDPSFGISLGGLEMTVSSNTNLNISLGGVATVAIAGSKTFQSNGTGVAGVYSAEDIAAALVTKYTGAATGSSLKIGNLYFKAEADGDTGVKFTYVGNGVDTGNGNAITDSGSISSADITAINGFLAGQTVTAAAATTSKAAVTADFADHAITKPQLAQAEVAGGRAGASITITGTLVGTNGNTLTIGSTTYTFLVGSGTAAAGANDIDLRGVATADRVKTAINQLANKTNTDFVMEAKSATVLHVDVKADASASMKKYPDGTSVENAIKANAAGTPAKSAGTTLKVTDDAIKDGNTITVVDGSVTTKYIFGKGTDVATGANQVKYIATKTAAALASAIGTKASLSNGVITIRSATANASVAAPTVLGKGLTLQIGDTAADYNQLNVTVQDCHSASLGIGNLSIATEEDAQAAIDKIKAAVNYVSDVRGTLGATQNRLDHTINNLSVMTENIQDAESTIRDVDVAEEMMAYTKNNILIQSAQAMLAQANQVPQGVLQLLQ